MSLTIGSLFSGIGGLELGLERAGLGPVKWQVEIDPYCRAVLAKHWPEAKRYEDVRTVGAELGSVDLICGGFPCQDLSMAGAHSDRLGLDGARSGLWSEYARIVGVVRPKFVVIENVSNLAGNGLDRVLANLAALGFDAEWQMLSAAAFGAPHLRERTFLVAYPNEIGCGRSVFRVPDGENREALLSQALPAGLGGPGFWELLPSPRICRNYDGIPQGRNRNRALGNAVVPQVAEFVARLIREFLTRCGLWI